MNDYHTDVTEEDITILIATLKKLNPSLVGIGVQSSHFKVAQRITKAIKENLNVPVVWGGAHPSIDPAGCIEHTDMVCVGEGFDALLELSRKILDGTSYHDVKNVWFNTGNGIIKNEMRPLLADLDVLPVASYDGENKWYIDDGRLQSKKNIDDFVLGLTDKPS